MILHSFFLRWRLFGVLVVAGATLCRSHAAPVPEVVVVYNSKVPESKEVAD